MNAFRAAGYGVAILTLAGCMTQPPQASRSDFASGRAWRGWRMCGAAAWTWPRSPGR